MLLGPKGAGKTTLMRVISTVIDPCGGDAEVCGIKTARDRKQKVSDMLERANLQSEAKKKAGRLSGLALKSLGIAQALIHDQKVLIADEPTAGLSPEERVRFLSLTDDLSKGRTVILSTYTATDIKGWRV